MNAFTNIRLGLLITRAYALCRGNRVIAGALAIFSLGALSIEIYCKFLKQQEHTINSNLLFSDSSSGLRLHSNVGNLFSNYVE